LLLSITSNFPLFLLIASPATPLAKFFFNILLLRMKKILVILAFISLSSCQEQRTSQKSVEEQTEPSEVTRVENPEEARLKRYLTFKSYFKKEIKQKRKEPWEKSIENAVYQKLHLHRKNLRLQSIKNVKWRYLFSPHQL